MKNKTALTLLAVIALAVPVAVCAQQNTTPAAPVVQQEGVTSLTLSVTERLPVKQDVILANVRYEAKGQDAKTLQNEINTKVKQALDAVKGDPDVKVSTEAYSVYMNQNQVQDAKTGQVTQTEEWRGSQAITLQGKDLKKLQTLTGTLQGMGFAVSNFSYTLSPEKSEEVRNTLMKGAVDKIKAQADQATKLLGKKTYDIREVNIDGGYFPGPQPMMFKSARAEMASDAMAAPNAEAGEQDVTMTLNARVDLK